MKKKEKIKEVLSNKSFGLSIKKEMMNYKKISFITLQFFIIIFFLFSCNDNKQDDKKQIKFEKEKWNEQTDPLFPSAYRPEMLNDLTSNYKLVGIKYSQLIKLLGIPDYKDSNSLSYKIIINYGHDIDPVYTKDLDFNFSKDSNVYYFKIDECKK